MFEVMYKRCMGGDVWDNMYGKYYVGMCGGGYNLVDGVVGEYFFI